MECHSCITHRNFLIIWNMSQEIRNRIASKVQILRKSKNLKKEELSLILGFDNSYVSKLEKGNINITIDKLAKISKFFEVDIKELL